MSAREQSFMVNMQASPVVFISHERKQVVNQYLYLHFCTELNGRI